MKKTHVLLLQEFLITQMNYWSVFPPVLVALILTAEDPGRYLRFFPLFMLLSLFPLYFFAVRALVGGPVLFFLLHIGAVALLYLVPIPDLPVYVCCLVLGALCMIYSFYTRVFSDEDWDDTLPLPIPAVIAGACIFLLDNMEISVSYRPFYFMIIYIVCLYFFIFFIREYLDFLTVNASSATQIPEEAIFLSGLKQTCGYVACSAVLLLLVLNIRLIGRLLGVFKKWLGMLLVYLMRFFVLQITTKEPEIETIELEQGYASFAQMAETPSFWLWDVLLYIVCIIIASAIIYVLAKGVIQTLLMLHSQLKKQRPDAETVEIILESDIREKLSVKRMTPKSPFSFWATLSINEKIRRLYRKQALSYEPNTIRLQRITARECAETLQTPDMGTLYEKARYSGGDCTAEDLKQMRSACKKAAFAKKKDSGGN